MKESPDDGYSKYAARYNAIVSEIAAYEKSMVGRSILIDPLLLWKSSTKFPSKPFMTAAGSEECSPLPITPGIASKLRVLMNDMTTGHGDTEFFEDQLLNCLLRKWPSRELLAMVAAERLKSSAQSNLATLLEHVQNPYVPDERLLSNPAYRECWEQRRLGILETYNTLRDLVPASAQRRAVNDLHILRSTAQGLKQRFDAVRRAVPSTLQDELGFYTQLGLLGKIYELIGNSTGFATEYDYLRSLREEVVPRCPDAGLREQMLQGVSWAKYLREKPLVQVDSVLAVYAQGYPHENTR